MPDDADSSMQVKLALSSSSNETNTSIRPLLRPQLTPFRQSREPCNQNFTTRIVLTDLTTHHGRPRSAAFAPSIPT